MGLNPQMQKKTLFTNISKWMHQNLFSSPGNTLLTLAGLCFFVWAIPPIFNWAIVDATWLGDSRTACDANAQRLGACWVFIKVRMNLFIYGFYPQTEQWRINLSSVLFAAAVLPLLMPATFKSRISQVILFLAAGAGVLAWWGPGFALFVLVFLLAPLVLERFSLRFLVFRSGIKAPVSRGLALACAGLWGAGAYGIMMMINAGQAAMAAAWAAGLVALPMLLFKPLPVRTWQYTLMLVVYPVFAFFMFTGEVLGLAHVETHFWGGLYLTLVIAVTGLVACLPIGILLALGRQSKMPAIKFICVFFIEIVRGVPLVSVLFMASVMFPLFLPPGAHFDKLLRALIGVSFFYAVYIAEVIRGGLQAIPKGQYEAAQALGWGYWKMMSLIIIPQTLRLVIPGLANNILSLFKDTTLVAVIGLLDLLGVAKAAMADAQWLGFTKEAYVFAGLVFWILCFSISRYSNHLEKKYHSSYH